MHNKMQHLDYEWSFFVVVFLLFKSVMNNDFVELKIYALTGRPAKLCQVNAMSRTFAGTGTIK